MKNETNTDWRDTPEAKKRIEQGCHPDWAHLTNRELKLKLRAYTSIFMRGKDNMSIEKMQHYQTMRACLATELGCAHRQCEGVDEMYASGLSPF